MSFLFFFFFFPLASPLPFPPHFLPSSKVLLFVIVLRNPVIIMLSQYPHMNWRFSIKIVVSSVSLLHAISYAYHALPVLKYVATDKISRFFVASLSPHPRLQEGHYLISHSKCALCTVCMHACIHIGRFKYAWMHIMHTWKKRQH